MRTDAKKNLKKVATEVLKHPLASEREIVKATGLSKGNVGDKLGKLGHLERNESMTAIAKADLEIVKLGQGLTKTWAKGVTSPKREDINTVTVAVRESQKRYSFLTGENATTDGGEKEFVFQDDN